MRHLICITNPRNTKTVYQLEICCVISCFYAFTGSKTILNATRYNVSVIFSNLNVKQMSKALFFFVSTLAFTYFCSLRLAKWRGIERFYVSLFLSPSPSGVQCELPIPSPPPPPPLPHHVAAVEVRDRCRGLSNCVCQKLTRSSFCFVFDISADLLARTNQCVYIL